MKWHNYRETFPINYSRKFDKKIPEKYQIEVTNYEHSKLETEAKKINKNPYQTEDQEGFILESKGLIKFFNQSTINDIKLSLESFGAVLIKNLPVDKNLPDTPKTGGNLTKNYKNSFVSESLLIALGNIMKSEPYNFRQEGYGSSPLIDNIVPIKKLASQKGAGGFKNNFPFHSESAWHRKRPDYIILFGQRGNKKAKTLVFSSSQLSKEILSQINNKDFIKSFRLKPPDLYIQMESYGIPLGTDKYSFIPPIQYLNGELRLNINFNGIDCNSIQFLNFLNELENFIEQHYYSTVLEKGTALIINNKITCHTRTGYEPLFNGRDRWFLRGYFKNDLWNSDRKQVREYLAKFSNLGWIDDSQNLNHKFIEYINNPKLLKNANPEIKKLADKAMYLTPNSDSRIV